MSDDKPSIKDVGFGHIPTKVRNQASGSNKTMRKELQEHKSPCCGTWGFAFCVESPGGNQEPKMTCGECGAELDNELKMSNLESRPKTVEGKIAELIEHVAGEYHE